MEDNAKDANNDTMNEDVNAADNNNATVPPKAKPTSAPMKPTAKKTMGENKDDVMPPPPPPSCPRSPTSQSRQLTPTWSSTKPMVHATTPMWQSVSTTRQRRVSTRCKWPRTTSSFHSYVQFVQGPF